MFRPAHTHATTAHRTASATAPTAPTPVHPGTGPPAVQVPPARAAPRVLISAGLATYEAGMKTLDTIVAAADAALNEAKERGRDGVTIADESFRMASTGVRQALHRAGAVPGN